MENAKPVYRGNQAMFQANITAFLAKDEAQATRLLPELMKPSNIQLPATWDEPLNGPTESDRPVPRVLLVAGLRDPRWLIQIAKHPFLGREIAHFLIFENNLDFLRAVFQQSDISQVIKHPAFHFFFDMNEESVKGPLFTVLADSERSKMMENTLALLDDDDTNPDYAPGSFYNNLPMIYKEVVEHVYHNYGQIHDSLDGVVATIDNTELIRTSPGLHELKDRFKGIPCVVAGAGPSLDLEIESIKANRDKFLLLAVDAALKPLLAAGIEPDYVFGLERKNLWQKAFYEGITPPCELICYPVLHPEVLEAYKGPKRLVYRNYSYFAFWEKQAPKGLLRSGGSVTHLASVVAQYMGVSSVMLLGADHAYEGSKETGYRSHCKNTGYKAWETYEPLDFYPKNRNHAPSFETAANDGSLVTTNITYFQFAKEFASQVIEGHTPFFHGAAKGVRHPGIPYQPFSEWLKDKQAVSYVKPENKALDLCKNFDYDVVLKQINAWLRVSIECLNLVQKAKTPRELEMLWIGTHELLCADSMFIAFILQNCAAELYRNENKIYGLPLEWSDNFEQRQAILEERMKLFQEVCMKVQAIFIEGVKAHGV